MEEDLRELENYEESVDAAREVEEEKEIEEEEEDYSVSTIMGNFFCHD